MNTSVITSTSNPIVKSLYELRKRPNRDERGLFLIEGYRAITRALEVGFQFEELYYCPEWYLGSNESELVKRIEAMGTRVTQLGQDALAKAAYRDRPEGLLGIGRQWHTKLKDLKLSENPFVIVVEAIEKPGNLETILRSADATGAEAVIVCDAVTDLFNPNVVRASTGVLFRVPAIVTSTDDALTFLKAHKITTVAATPAATTLYTDVDYRNPAAIIMGSEQFGLTDSWLKTCDQPVRLPMMGLADSLNVSAATVVMAYEVLRQRSLNKPSS
jgi:TrmH family RNA methyltransferase